MFTKPNKSKEHKRLEILEKRTTLSIDQQQSLDRLSTGYKGELYFSKLVQTELQCEPIVLYDLLLEINGSECQIDCLLIFQNELILIEIKNYQGDFFIENNDWYKLPKNGIKNPLYQLQRTELLLNQFLKQHQLTLKVKAFVVFTHPEFQLYQAPLNIPLVFHTQLKRFIQRLQNIPCQISKHNHNIEKLLKSNHKTSSAYESSLFDDYAYLKKGVTCGKCNGLMEMSGAKNMLCLKCGFIDRFERATMRNVCDFHTLFPDEKMTVSAISNWTDNHASKYRIRTILSKHCQFIKNGRNSYYLLNKDISKLLKS